MTGAGRVTGRASYRQQRGYWQERLAGASSMPRLPAPAGAPDDSRSGRYVVVWQEVAFDSLQRCAGLCAGTQFDVLLAALMVVLQRYSGGPPPVIGTLSCDSVDERGAGPIFNLVALRTEFDPGISGRELLQRVSGAVIDAGLHRDYAFTALLQERKTRERDAAPLLDAVLVPCGIEGGVSEVACDEPDSTALKALAGGEVPPLVVIVRRASGAFELDLRFDPVRCAAPAVRRLAGHLGQVVQAFAADSEKTLSRLALLTPQERHQILEVWSHTDGDYGAPACIHALIAQQAQRAPHAVAVRARGRQLSYCELDQRSSRLAWLLRERGAGRDAPIGICLERTPELVVALLGILKAGAAYLPLDPQYPTERLEFMLGDARAALVVTQRALADVLPPGTATLVLEDEAPHLAEPPIANFEQSTDPKQLAYFMYTSGSTGRPKGVAISHDAVCQLLRWAGEAFGDDLAEMLASTSICFDLSVFELFAPLTLGGRVVLVESILDLPRLGADEQVRWVNTVPSALIEALSLAQLPPSVRSVGLAGEALPEPLVRRLYAMPNVQRVVNLYGPTEDTVYSTCAVVPRNGPVTIGRPIPGTRCYVLDGARQPVPVGVPGELYLGGTGLAREYLRRAALTAERFVPNPFLAGTRLYRTGDLVRWLEDGNLDFVGRIDHQIKIRGFRIEPGEIESRLARHPGVREAVVVGREGKHGDRRLVAYLVPEAGERLSATELRAHLRQSLPEHMVPGAFVVLERLPLTPNGKLDRDALPAPDVARPEAGNVYVAPRNPLEWQIAEIWCEVLERERIGVQDDFFALGGHSLLATQVIARLRDVLQTPVALRVLFEAPTVERLALHVQHVLGERGPAPTDAPEDGEAPGAEGVLQFPASFAQQRLWFLDQFEDDHAVYVMRHAVQLRGPLQLQRLIDALNEVVRRHDSLRTTLRARDGVPVQVIAPHLVLEVPLVDLSHLPEEERARAVVAEQSAEPRPFDLARGPLLRLRLLRLAVDRHVLLMEQHHAISDGWSLEVFLRELATLLAPGRAALPRPTLQYPDYAVWQRGWLQGSVLEEQLAYWRSQLGGLVPLDLPGDRPRPPALRYDGADERRDLPPELSAAIRALSRSYGATPFMTMLAAFQVLLGRLAGSDDVAIGTPIAGRHHPDTEGMIGFFVNTLVMRTNLAGDPSFVEVLGRVRETALGAYAHQDIPFERLVEALQPPRRPGRHPLFDIMINASPIARDTWSAGDLELRLLDGRLVRAKFAITLCLEDHTDAIGLRMQYQAGLFDAPRMRILLAQLESLLQQVVKDPQCRIGACSLVTDETRSVLPDPTAELECPVQLPITAQFLQLAARQPHHAAVRHGARSWAYAELAEAATAIARWLHERALSGRVVAVTGPRSFGAVAAMMGVLMSRAVLLPVDPALPRLRREQLLGEADALLLLRVQDADEVCDEVLPVETARVESASGAGPCPVAKDAVLPPVDPDGAAYIFFTSGSTGVPKGVLGRHRSLSHFLAWERETFAIGAQDRVAQLTGFSFDVFLRDLFLPLTSGATVCLPREEDLLDIPEWLARERISVLHVVPSVAQVWIAGRTAPRTLQDLRWTLMAGEPLAGVLVERWRQAFPDSGELVNLYGATEATMAQCWYRVPDPPSPGIQPVGRPLPDTQALVLNAHGGLCGIGELGEVVLRTPFTSLGYLTERGGRSFGVNPFRDDPQDALYYTGDCGRYRPDGQLELCGRGDDQIKINGVRVEPAEVNATLTAHPKLQASCVVAAPDTDGALHLTAYAVPRAGMLVDAQELRGWLRDRLPDALVPARVQLLGQLPLLPTGKVDRQALRKAAAEAAPPLRDSVTPRNHLEESLAELWHELLPSAEVGVHDSFFALGGHSLLATQMLARIRRRFGVTLPVRSLFQSPTIAQLAAAIEAARATPDPSAVGGRIPARGAARRRIEEGGS